MGSFYLPARVLSPESPGEPRSPSCLAGPTLPKHLPLRGAVVWLLPPPPKHGTSPPTTTTLLWDISPAKAPIRG